MPTFANRLTGIFEIAMSIFGAAILIVQTIAGADGVAQIAAALVTLVAPVCAAIRSTNGNVEEIAGAVADAVTTTLDDQDETS